jgi:tight adherence protein C
MDIKILLVSVVMGGVVFFISWMLMPSQRKLNIEFRLGDSAKERETKSIFLKYFRPIFIKLFMGILVQLKTPFFENYKKEMHRKLVVAGLKDEIEPLEVLGYKLFMAMLIPGFLFFVFYGLDVAMPFYIYLSALIFGFFYPDLWIGGSRKARQKSIRLSMPFVVDLLCLSTEAGLDFGGAIGRVVEKAIPGALVRELEQFLNETRLGTQRAEALRNMAWRIDMTEVSSFVSILITADQMGASIGPVLRAQSEQLRHDRFIRAEKAGQAASQKILFPLIFFILPAVFIMIFGPIIVKFITQGKPF